MFKGYPGFLGMRQSTVNKSWAPFLSFRVHHGAPVTQQYELRLGEELRRFEQRNLTKPKDERRVAPKR